MRRERPQQQYTTVSAPGFQARVAGTPGEWERNGGGVASYGAPGGDASIPSMNEDEKNPYRFAALLRSYALRNGAGMTPSSLATQTDAGGTPTGLGLTRAGAIDQPTLQALASSLSDSDAMAINGPRPNPHGGAYLPSAQEWRMQAAQRLVGAGFPFQRLVAGR